MSNSIDILKPFHRQYSGPLDITAVFNEISMDELIYRESNGSTVRFDTSDELANYYATRPIAYSGQIISVIDPVTKTYTVYVITGSDSDISNRTAEPIGSADGVTIGYCNEIPISIN